MIDKLKSVKEALKQITLLDGELNMNNYGEEDVSNLNQQFINAFDLAETALVELNEVMERLNSEELWEEMAAAALKASEKASFDDRVRSEPIVFYKLITQAAINIIRGKE